MRISENFWLSEFLKSRTANLHDIDMTPPEGVKQNIIRLVKECLQPIRDQLRAPIVISSGYRPEALNTLIGGSKTSAHMRGLAADFDIVGYSAYQAVEMIQQIAVPYDQLINEFQSWVHLGMDEIYPVGQVMTASRQGGKTVYQYGNLS